MPGLLKHSGSLRVSEYKKAGSAARSKMLDDAIQQMKRLHRWWNDSEEKANIYNTMVEISQLINYAHHTQLIETQQSFAIAFDTKPLLPLLKENNAYFEIPERGQLRLKKPIAEIPSQVWTQLRAAQQSYLGGVFQKHSSTMDVYDILTPPDVEFQFGAWYNDNSFHEFTLCETAQASLLAVSTLR